jgi:hypothetical protein
MICITIGCKKASVERRGPKALSYVEDEGKLGTLLLKNDFELGCSFIDQLLHFFEHVL